MHSSHTLKLIVCILGIFVCYFYYGIIQEKITRSKYGPDKTPFTFALSLVCIQCVVNAMFVKICKLLIAF
ncbi:Solute carrier family 35 member B1 [Trichinella papuae]|uniref:Solute carrier family 35 member B1 n=1 Tax=Trichinella papuae TaxID=268474 RepID=A0A0V1N701_9BILA|nr:Solute carrier family 35 member B1 [Trichinella papuae]